LLATVLREGGMVGAIRNIPSKGYRFCIDDEAEVQPHIPATTGEQAQGVRTGAQRAASAQLWTEAAALFEAADAAGILDGADLHQWALALQCTGRSDAAMPVLVRAVTAHTEAGNVPPAVLDAITLSGLYFERGQARSPRAGSPVPKTGPPRSRMPRRRRWSFG
jgi:hypothetical protein